MCFHGSWDGTNTNLHFLVFLHPWRFRITLTGGTDPLLSAPRPKFLTSRSHPDLMSLEPRPEL